MSVLDDVNVDVARYIIGSDSNIALAAERISTDIKQRVNEYDIIEFVSRDNASSKSVATGLRSLLVMRLFDFIQQLQGETLSRIDELKPGELVRAYGAAVQAFTSLTSVEAKSPFDFDTELRKAADELGVSTDEALTEIKHMFAKNKLGR